MADALLQLFYFVRPVMFAYVDVRFFGLGFFEILTILMVGVLFCAFHPVPTGIRGVVWTIWTSP